MKEIKERWQFIVGFAAIIISLSAFKDELNKISIDFQFITFTLSQYLLALIVSFILVIHLYAIPYIFSTTTFSNLKIFKFIESLSYFLFLVIVISPSLLLIMYLIQLSFVQFTGLNEKTKYILSLILSAFNCVMVIALSIYQVKRYQSLKRTKEELEIVEKELKLFEISDKLLKEGYYNHSIFETFKMVENGIYKTLLQRDLIFRKTPVTEMIKIAEKHSIFTEKEIQKLNNIRKKRNKFAHSIESTATKEDAEDALKFAKDIFASTGNNEVQNK